MKMNLGHFQNLSYIGFIELNILLFRWSRCDDEKEKEWKLI